MQTHVSQVSGTLRTATESFGDWQEHKGGRITSEVSESRAPGAKYSTKAPGPRTIENITLVRDYELPRDGTAYDRLEALCGTQTEFIVGKPVRDSAGNVIRQGTRVGILLELMDIEGDTNGGTTKGTLEAVFGING